MNIGTIHAMKISEKTDDGYMLTKGLEKAFLPLKNSRKLYHVNEIVDVFLYKKSNRIWATTYHPKVMIGVYDWAEVVELIPNLGVFVDIGIEDDMFVSGEDLPLFKSVWPNAGDKVYVTLKVDKKGRLFAIPAKENIFADLFNLAFDVELNEQVNGRAIHVSREGTVIITDDLYRGFIHRTEREIEPRLGEYLTGRVIEVKEDGTLNVSLLPLKHERIDQDAQKILNLLHDRNGVIPFSDKSDPEQIRHQFQMSKSAFKRALGRLMKEGKVEQRDGGTVLLK